MSLSAAWMIKVTFFSTLKVSVREFLNLLEDVALTGPRRAARLCISSP